MRKLFDTAKKVSFNALILSILLSVMVVVIFYQVLSRYVFKFSLIWPEELGRVCFIWLVYIGTSYAAKKDRHLKITIFRDLMPNSVRFFIDQISILFSLAFSLFCTFYGFTMVKFLFESAQTSPGLVINVGWFYLAIPIGFSLTSLNYLKIFMQLIKKQEHTLSCENKGVS